MARDSEMEGAHRHSSKHRAEILGSSLCGCFYCLEIFPPERIREWVDGLSDGIGRTALCPHCGVDSLIGSNAGLPIERVFLEKMRAYWF